MSESRSAEIIWEVLGGVDAEVTIDTAFYDTQSTCVVWERDEELWTFFENHSKVVGVTLSDFVWNIPLKEKKDAIQGNEAVVHKFLDELTEQGYGILLIPQLFGNQDDTEYLLKFLKDNVFILSNQYDTYAQQDVISRCYALVGMRYHSNIFAAKAGVPFLAIGYEEKMFGFMREWGLEEYLLYIDQLTIKGLADRWKVLEETYQGYQDRLKKQRNTWQEIATKTVNAIMEEIR